MQHKCSSGVAFLFDGATHGAHLYRTLFSPFSFFPKNHYEFFLGGIILKICSDDPNLPYIASKAGERTLKDLIIPRFNEVQQLTALPEASSRISVVGEL